jgi:rfaE bifunctional protein kinase chain/domain|tara:strand:+ start:144 stop:1682 length:1539 start_codon:yes stop_codon:yes gene_type:complete
MKEYSQKIVSLTNLLHQKPLIGWQDASLCFGHFNVIHPGHLRYFETARTHGEQLVIALEGDNVLSIVKREECFPEMERAQAVASLEIVDKVVILNTGGIEDLVDLIKPQSLVLGREYERDHFNEISEAVTRHGGQVIYEPGEIHYATAEFFRGTQHEIERQRRDQFRSALNIWNIDLNQVLLRLKSGPAPRILVVGDTIVDRYIACDPVGMSNEAPVVVVKELETRDFVGGAAIVAAHVATLNAECIYLSVVGKDQQAEMVRSNLSELEVTADLLEDLSRPTTNKLRYMVENQKLFRVSRLKEHNLSTDIENTMIKKIEELAPSLQGILVCDFVYGVITPRIIEALAAVSRQHGVPLFGDLQCSSQVGSVLKFQDFQLLCPTEREARIALSNQNDSVEYVANLLMETTCADNLIIKLGAEGFIAYARKELSNFFDRQHFPALTSNPADVAGAGDALLAAVAVGLARGLTLMESASLGTCMAALAVQTVGNQPVRLEELVNFALRTGAASNAE